MNRDTNYCYKGSTEFVIENGVMKGRTEEPYLTEHNNFGEYILEQLKKTPEFIGQIDGVTGREESFGEIMEKSIKCAMWLKEQNLQLNDIVGICTHNQMDMYVPCLASLYIGSIHNPWWHTEITKDMARHFLTLTSPKVVFADEVSADLIHEVAKEIDIPLQVIVFGNVPAFQSLDEILASQNAKNIAEFQCTTLSSCADAAVLLYTSGSTGLPKGVKHSHNSLYGNTYNYIATSKTKGTTISLIFSPLAWATGILGTLRGIIARETRIIQPVFSEEITFQSIEKFKINWLLLAPSGVARLQKSSVRTKYDLSSLKILYVVGSVLKKEVHEALAMDYPQTSVRQMYGTTEMGGATTDQHSDHPKFGSCGTILKNVHVKVVDPDSGAVLGPNQKGEACFRSKFMMTCYYKNPKATSEAVDEEGWLHTGDLVHYDEEGNIYVTDRIKEMIKYRGHHVSPAMVEQLLARHPAVIEVGVVAKPHEIDDEHPMAFLVKKPNAQVTEKELMQVVADKLPDYMRLRGGIQFLEKMPHTPSGKISKSHLKNIARSGKV